MDKVRLGAEYQDDNFVLTFPDGRPMQPDYLSRKFCMVLRKHGLEHIRFHDLRHTVATLMITSEANMKFVQEVMGHASLSTTANIYAHVSIKEKEDALSKMYAAVKAASAG